MGVRLIVNTDDNLVALYCSTDMEAFGPLFDSEEAAQDFLDWLPTDPRRLTLPELRAEHERWHALAHDAGGEYVGREPREPSDDDIYNRTQCVPDGRSENDRSL